MEQQSTDDLLVDLSASRFSVAFSVMFFVFGTAAGFLLAFSGFGFLEDSAGVIAGVFLVALSVIALSGIALFLLRNRILTRLFGIAGAQIDVIAGPLADVAQGAARRDPEQAAQSARRLIQVALARYAWLATRRWIMTSLTALIAAMAALAGTALLFKQNQLIAAQTDLLREQNVRIQEQTQLIQTDVQLAEAERNAALAVEITDIAAELGKVVDRVHGKGLTNPFNVLDPSTDLDRSLFLRIVSISRALMPYRFLDTGLHEEDTSDGLRLALQRRRDDLGDSYPQLEALFGWSDRPEGTYLVDRPASPERGQLLRVMVSSGLRNLELFTFAGLTLDHAMLKATDLSLITAQQARLSYADFSGSYLVECDFGSAILENARFRRANISRTRFAALSPDQVLPPLPPQSALAITRMSGADFALATITGSDFSGAALTAASFDGALLDGVNFSSADLSVATFRDTVILDADFTGASLKRTDFDGTIVFGEDFLTRLAAASAPGSFRPELFTLAPIDPGEVAAILVVSNVLTPEDIAARTGGLAPYRIARVGDFGP